MKTFECIEIPSAEAQAIKDRFASEVLSNNIAHLSNDGRWVGLEGKR